MGRYLGQ